MCAHRYALKVAMCASQEKELGNESMLWHVEDSAKYFV